MMGSSAENEVPIRLLTVSGSVREASFNRRLNRLLERDLPAYVELHHFAGLKAVEVFSADDEDLDAVPPGVAAWRSALRAAHGVVFSTPEYNSSIPGQLKNALDWASRSDDPDVSGLAGSALYGRPVAVMSVSTGQFGAAWSRDELVNVLKRQGARVLDTTVSVASATSVFTDDVPPYANDAPPDALVAKVMSLRGELVDLIHSLRAAHAAVQE